MTAKRSTTPLQRGFSFLASHWSIGNFGRNVSFPEQLLGNPFGRNVSICQQVMPLTKLVIAYWNYKVVRK